MSGCPFFHFPHFYPQQVLKIIKFYQNIAIYITVLNKIIINYHYYFCIYIGFTCIPMVSDYYIFNQYKGYLCNMTNLYRIVNK